MSPDLEIIDTEWQQTTANAAVATAEAEPNPAQGGHGRGHRGPDRGVAGGAGQHCRANTLTTTTLNRIYLDSKNP